MHRPPMSVGMPANVRWLTCSASPLKKGSTLSGGMTAPPPSSDDPAARRRLASPIGSALANVIREVEGNLAVTDIGSHRLEECSEGGRSLEICVDRECIRRTDQCVRDYGRAKVAKLLIDAA